VYPFSLASNKSLSSIGLCNLILPWPESPFIHQWDCSPVKELPVQEPIDLVSGLIYLLLNTDVNHPASKF
jgi:hypothetical protein